MNDPATDSVWSLEAAASAAAEPGYLDPATGYLVFTSYGHRQRGRCCGRACRHCPFAHEAVPSEALATAAQQPCWLRNAPAGKPVTLALRTALTAAPTVDAGWLVPCLMPDRRLPADGEPLAALLAMAPAQSPVLLIPLQPRRSFAETACQALTLLPAGSHLVLPAAASRHALPGTGQIADWQADTRVLTALSANGLTATAGG